MQAACPPVSASTHLLLQLGDGGGGLVLVDPERDIDRYGRIVGQCFLPDGRDITAAMIASGTAREFCRYWGRKPRQKTWDSYSRWRNWLKKSRRSFEENRTGILVPFKNGHDAAPRHDDDFISRQLERQKQADAIRAAAASRLVQ